MSILAGVLSRHRTPIAPGVESALRASLSRNPAHKAIEHRAEGVYLCKIDIGAFRSPGTRTSATGSVTMVAGNPLLTGVSGPRSDHADALHDAVNGNDWAVLERARGTYCAVHYSPVDHSVALIGDKLGVRPLYYYVSRDFVFFASAIRVLEAIADVPKIMDLRGVAELIAFGHTLGRRTPFADIAVLHSGEVMRAGADSTSLRTYWAWDQRVAAGAHSPASPRRLHELFVRAVQDRLTGDHKTLAFLSGGLDSRCIVSALRALGTEVHTFNFHWSAATQEAVLAQRIADALGCDHHSLPLPELAVDWQRPSFAGLAAIGAADPSVERAKLAWSGDGGSVGAGFVYVDEDIVRCMRDGRARDAIQIFVGRFGSGLSRHLFARGIRREITGLPVEGALAELDALSAVEPARRFHLFLMVNNQRRHLAEHFEDIDLRDLDLELPFFDADFLSALFTVSVDESVGHALYHRTLDEFTPVTRSVPWQTYPGHVKCPLPIPPGLAGQWDQGVQVAGRRAAKNMHMANLRRIVRSSDFPRSVLSRTNLFAYLAAYRLGVSDYGWASVIAGIVQRYWSRGGHSYVISPLNTK